MFPATTQDLRRCYGRIGLFLIVYTALSQVAVMLCYLPYHLGWYKLFFSDWYYYGLSAMAYYPAGVLAAVLTLRGLPRPKVLRAPAPTAGQICSALAIGIGLLYLGSMTAQVLLSDTETVDYAGTAVESQPVACTLVYVVLLAPVMEELIFRYLLLDRMLFLGDWTAVGLSALMFGLFHTNLYQFFYAVLVGLLLGYLRIMTGTLTWSILLHMFINFFGGLLTPNLPDSDVVWSTLGLAVMLAIGYTVYYLIRCRPWENFYPGPTAFTAAEKRRACLTSPLMWACVLLHLGLSLYYISY